MPTEEVLKAFAGFRATLSIHEDSIQKYERTSILIPETLSKHDIEIAALKSEITNLKAQVGMKTRIAQPSPMPITPFAQRLTSGGIK